MSSAVLEHVVMGQSENHGQGTFRLAPLERMPLRLGFPDSSQVLLEAVQGTPYAKLARERKLPPPRIRCKDKPTKKTFLDMATGSLQGEYTYQTSTTEEGVSHLVLKVGGNDASTPEQLKGHLMEVDLEAGPNSSLLLIRPRRFAYETMQYNNGRFGSLLTPEEKLDLAHRVVHLFVRAFGIDLPFRLLKDIDDELDDYYPRNRHFLEGKDAKIMFADTSIHSDRSPIEIGHALIKIGEYTESEGDSKNAGYLYGQVIDSYGSFMEPLQLARCHHFAGLALRNGKVMDKAEDYLVRGWNVYCKYQDENARLIDLNDKEPTDLFTTLLVLYDMLAEKAGRSGFSHSSRVQEIHPIFCALMYQAGFQAGCGGRSHSMVFSHGRRMAGTVLPLGFTKRAALYVTVQAARYDLAHSPTTAPVEHFRQMILSAKDPHSIVGTVSDFSQADPYYECDPKKDAKQMRRTLRKAVGAGTRFERCINCGRTERQDGGGANLRCSCHTAVYCGKECQKAHWKDHKKICSIHLEKKAAKKVGK